MEDYEAVYDYLFHGKYPDGFEKKVLIRRKSLANFKVRELARMANSIAIIIYLAK